MAATLRVPDAQSCNRAHLPIPGYAIHDTRQHRWKSRRFQSEETPAEFVELCILFGVPTKSSRIYLHSPTILHCIDDRSCSV
jgi:hypothetical protein